MSAGGTAGRPASSSVGMAAAEVAPTWVARAHPAIRNGTDPGVLSATMNHGCVAAPFAPGRGRAEGAP